MQPALPVCLFGENILCKNTDVQSGCDHCNIVQETDPNAACQYCGKGVKLRNNIATIVQELNITEVTYKAVISIDRIALKMLTTIL